MHENEMSEDFSNNRSRQDRDRLSDEEDHSPIQTETSETEIQYVSVQDQFDLQHPLLLHWKNLCEEMYRDMQEEIKLKNEREKRIAELEKIDSILYPEYTTRMRKMKRAKLKMEELARKYPHCVKLDGNVYVALSRKECKEILHDFNKKQTNLEDEASDSYISEQDLDLSSRLRFGGHVEQYFYSKFGKPTLKRFFRRIDFSEQDLTPDLVAITKARSNTNAKILIHGRCFVYNSKTVVQILRRINEIPDMESKEQGINTLRPRSALSIVKKGQVQSVDREHLLRKTYVISEATLARPMKYNYTMSKGGDVKQNQNKHFNQRKKSLTKDSETFEDGTVRSDSPFVSSNTFSPFAPLPRIHSTESQKSFDANLCIVEGHALKRRPLSGPEITSPKYSTRPSKAAQTLPPLLTSEAAKLTTQNITGFDLETKEKKFLKSHENYKKTRPNSPVKRNGVNKSSRTINMSVHIGPGTIQEPKRERALPLPPIKDNAKVKKTH